MSINILMPALSPTMQEGNLQKWLVKEGDKVKAGDVLAEIETDKATMEVEAVDEGTVTKILIKEGTECVAVNSIIAILNGSNDIKNDMAKKDYVVDETELLKKEKNIKKNLSKSNVESLTNNNTNDKVIKNKEHKRILVSPYAKKIAKENNINLTIINGSGPDGRIIKRDILENNNIDKEFIFSSNYEIIEPSNIRKVIAKRISESKNTVPHFYLKIKSNVEKLIKLKNDINYQYPKLKVSINDILIKALAIAQKNNPDTNVSWHDGKIIKYSAVDVSVAVALKEGLITPIIKNADKKGLLEISKEIKILANKARNGQLSPEEYNGGTISISNLGMYGINEFSAIINPPQSSILAIGAINKLPREINNKIEHINILNSTLSADHRVLDGAVAAKLLKDFNDIIENPFNIWLESNDMEMI